MKKRHLTDLDLSMRAYHALETLCQRFNAEHTIEGVLGIEDVGIELMKIPGAGRLTIFEIEQAFRDKGINIFKHAFNNKKQKDKTVIPDAMENPFEQIYHALKSLEDGQRIINAKLDKILGAEPGGAENMTVDEASAFLKLSTPTIHRLKAANKIPFVKVGARTIYRKSQLLTWMDQKSKSNGSSESK